MNEVKHTPGPWVLQKRDENIFRIVSSCVWEWDIATVDNDVDCIRGGANEDGISLQSIANAKLIAAAPDMLEAIQCAINLKDLWNAQQHGTVSAEHAGEMEALQKMQDKLEAALMEATTT